MPIQRSLCPTCGYLNGEHSFPITDTVMMCLNCAGLSRLGNKGKLVAATEADMEKLNIYQRQVVEAMQKHVAERGPIMKPEKPS